MKTDPPKWRVVTVDKSSETFLEKELKELMSLIVRLMEREVVATEKHMKRMRG